MNAETLRLAQDAVELTAHCALWIGVLVRAAAFAPWPALRARRWPVAAVAAVAAPALSYYSYGIAGPLSVLTIVLLAQWLVRQYRGTPAPFVPQAWRWSIVGAGALLYASTLGWVEFDLYRLGYEAYAGGALAFPLALLAFVLRRQGWASWGVLGACWLWFADLLPSANLWDAVLDGVLWLIASAGLLAPLGARVLRAFAARRARLAS